MKYRLTIIVLLLTTACAFKDSKITPAVESAEQGATTKIQYGWNSSKGTDINFYSGVIKNSGSTWKGATPLLLPANIPNELIFSFQKEVIGESSIKTARAEASLSPSSKNWISLNTKILAAEDIENSQKIQISGINSLLKSEEEGEINLRITINETVIELLAVTPPSRIEILQETVLAYEAEPNHKNISHLKVLNAISMKAALLQVLSITNRSQYPVQLSSHVQVGGKLTSHFVQKDLNAHFCSYELATKEWDQTLSDQIIFAPLTNTLNRDFFQFLNEHWGINLFSIHLEPSETTQIGIYGVGKDVESIANGQYPRPKLTATQVVTKCISRCGDRRKDAVHWDGNLSASRYWVKNNWPGASRICEKLRNQDVSLPDGNPDENLINECAAWDLSNHFAPWDERRYCQSMPPGNPWGYAAREYWIINKTFTNVNYGIESGPVFLKLLPESFELRAQIDLGDDTGSAPARSFFNAIQNNTVQLQ